MRELAGFGFPSSDATAYGFIGEVVLDEPPAGGALNTHGADGALIVLPMGGGRFRLTGVDVHRQAPDEELTLDVLRDLTRRMTGRDLGMRDPSWLTRSPTALTSPSSTVWAGCWWPGMLPTSPGLPAVSG